MNNVDLNNHGPILPAFTLQWHGIPAARQIAGAAPIKKIGELIFARDPNFRSSIGPWDADSSNDTEALRSPFPDLLLALTTTVVDTTLHRTTKGECLYRDRPSPDGHQTTLTVLAPAPVLARSGNIFALQRVMGHSDLETTRKYVNMTTADLQAAHQRVSPLPLGADRT